MLRKILKLNFLNILSVSLFLFVFSFVIVNACESVSSFEINASDEKGSISFEKKQDFSPRVFFYKEEYPGLIEFYVDNIKLQPKYEHDDVNGNRVYDLANYSTTWFPRDVLISVKQDGKEFYTAKWAISYLYGPFTKKNMFLTILLAFSVFMTFLFVAWGIISSLIGKWKVSHKIILLFIIFDIILIFLKLFNYVC